MKALGSIVVGLAIVAAQSGMAWAQNDHLKCYKIKDPQKLSALADLNSPQFGLEAGCRVSKAKYFCVPAEKSNVTDKKTGDPVVLLPLYADPAPGDRICYKIKCPRPAPADQAVTDQFGTRTFSKFKAGLLCTPAVKGTEYCGDGVLNGTEQCDDGDDAACPGACQVDCTCPVVCQTACCYIELPPGPFNPADASCVEYTGTAAQVNSFANTCLGWGWNGVLIHTPLMGPCNVAPNTGVPCPGGGPNNVVAPKDSSCP